MPFYIF